MRGAHTARESAKTVGFCVVSSEVQPRRPGRDARERRAA